MADNEPEKPREDAPEKTISPEEKAAKEWAERREREWREKNEAPDIKKSWERFRESVSKHANDLAAEDKPKLDKEAAEAKSDPEVKHETELKLEAKSGEESQDEREFKPLDRMWTGPEQELEPKDMEVLQQRVTRADQGVRGHIEKHEQRGQIEAGLRNMFSGRPDQHRDFIKALTEVKNHAEVVSHLGLNKTDRNILLQQPNWKAFRAAVHHLSKSLAPKVEAKAEPESPPKPRAPKPPVEVGGRGLGGGDDSLNAARDGNFAAFDRAEWAKRRARA
ncbi:MAG: hypothetical protein ACRD3P_00770 [Terriglobales bacterium]